jgi:chloride channel 3/4/5
LKSQEDSEGGDAKINGIRVWYSSFTSIDWLHDAIKDSLRFSRLRKRKSVRAKVRLYIDKSLGWIIVTIVGFLTAVVAFLVVRSEQLLFDWKEGYCVDGWGKSKRFCCPAEQTAGRMASPFLTRAEEELCSAWRPWSGALSSKHGLEGEIVEYASYTSIAVSLCLYVYVFRFASDTDVTVHTSCYGP